MSSRKGRKNFAGASNYNFCYFLYFCGTIKIGNIRNFNYLNFLVARHPVRVTLAFARILSVAAFTVFVAIRVRGIAYDSKGRGWLPV